jgi:hypothetical protein
MRVYLSATMACLTLAVTITATQAADVKLPSYVGAEAVLEEDGDSLEEYVQYCSEAADYADGLPGVQGCCDEVVKAVAPKPNPCATSHKGVFYLNDFSYLDDPANRHHCLGDSLKRMPLGDCGEWGTLDVGGQLRLRYHHEGGMGNQAGRLGFRDTVNDFLLTRFRLYSDWRANEYLRVYVEGITADETGNSLYVPRAIDVNYGDLTNAFVDLSLTEEFTLRTGRQELLYGNQRLVSPLDWSNTRRTFEGIRGLYKSGDWAIDGFYTHYVPVVDDQFDTANYNQTFYGLYSTYTGYESQAWDFYYLGYDDERQGIAPAVGDFSLHTFGSRVLGTTEQDWLYEFESAYQGGRQSGLGQDQSAGMATAGLGRKLPKMAWDPTVWFYLDYASGNYPGGDFNRFNQLFPLGHKYLGYIDAVARSNVITPNVQLVMKPQEKLELLFWYYNFTAISHSDVIPGVGFQSDQRFDSRSFGNELDMTAKYALSPRSYLLVGYSHLWRGSKIIGTNDADFFYTQWELNF